MQREENDAWSKEDKIHDGRDMKRERRDSSTKKKEEIAVQENVKSGTVRRTETYQHLGITNRKVRKARRTYKDNSKKM